jgi:mannose-1-phosphate guanylyltransferase/mannose-6-phosphate isomerase
MKLFDQSDIYPVLLCGGSGTRLWPLSRTHYPKQFLEIGSNRSLLQETVQRILPLCKSNHLVAVANEDHRFLLAEQLREIGVVTDILLEPVARNTAPAIAAAVLWIQKKHAAPLVLVLPADHHIIDIPALHQALAAGVELAREGQLVTFGIVPDRAETGFGYIKRGKPQKAGFEISRFIEKPALPKAREYLESGDHYWNSGMFLFRADTFIEALIRYAPAIASAVKASVANVCIDHDFIRLEEQSFSSSPSNSIDYAVMEAVRNAVVVPLDAGWSDIGAWDAVARASIPDGDNNHIHGDVLVHETKDSFVRADSRLVTLIGVNNIIVIETADAVLVAEKSKVQAVKHIVRALKEANRKEIDCHPVVQRPWGSYEALAAGSRYEVKRIIVKPGQSLSLQKHAYRAEHWVIVSGSAAVTRGDETFQMHENESVYIPLGVMHRLSNTGCGNLEIIEVKTGSYLGEDDIVRYEDLYGRGKEK